MKLRGETDPEDWHPSTLIATMADRSCWHGGVSWRKWRLHYAYGWYDGPVWQLQVGPFRLSLSWF
ncbi:MAG: hypothetical protein IKE42_02485 [Aquamicrobium sp.]|jgi:hypothetical protein|uniref:hypothetical protein n=1 Tax=Mesorhizobium TaxID=68287 RepID=UPI001011D6C2|nr:MULTISPECIES: hypothetical protein [Mesorhizobium]MBR2686694.1 hypothetical protein [Aquamicrobium sp.]QAZ42711.1 hypothetical protein C1M53_06800 [Mesorhizobium sp. Pch-S]